MASKLRFWAKQMLRIRGQRRTALLFAEFQHQEDEVDISQVWPDTPSSARSLDSASSQRLLIKSPRKPVVQLQHLVVLFCGRYEMVDVPTDEAYPVEEFVLQRAQPVAENWTGFVGSETSDSSKSTVVPDTSAGASLTLHCAMEDGSADSVGDDLDPNALGASGSKAHSGTADRQVTKSWHTKFPARMKRRAAQKRRRKAKPLPVLPDGHRMNNNDDYRESRRIAEFTKNLQLKSKMDMLLDQGILRIDRRTQNTSNCCTYAGQFHGRDVLIKETQYVPGTIQEVKLLTDVRFSSSLQHERIVSHLLCVVLDAEGSSQQDLTKRKLVTIQPVHGLSMAYALKRCVFHDRCHGGKPKLRPILKVFSQVVEAVRILHKQGIVHGGIRADSVLLTGGVKLHAVLSDFQLATKLKKDKVKLTSFMIGALGCVPPEMYEGVQINGSRCGVLSKDSDMYCLGVLLWHAVCRQPAFKVNKAKNMQEPQGSFPHLFPGNTANALRFSNVEQQVLSRLDTLTTELTSEQPWDRPSIFDVCKEVNSLVTFLETCPPAPFPIMQDLEPIPECDSESLQQPPTPTTITNTSYPLPAAAGSTTTHDLLATTPNCASRLLACPSTITTSSPSSSTSAAMSTRTTPPCPLTTGTPSSSFTSFPVPSVTASTVLSPAPLPESSCPLFAHPLMLPSYSTDSPCATPNTSPLTLLSSSQDTTGITMAAPVEIVGTAKSMHHNIGSRHSLYENIGTNDMVIHNGNVNEAVLSITGSGSSDSPTSSSGHSDWSAASSDKDFQVTASILPRGCVDLFAAPISPTFKQMLQPAADYKQMSQAAQQTGVEPFGLQAGLMALFH